MNNYCAWISALLILIVIPGCAATRTQSGHLYREGKSLVGILLCHGRGQDPDWHVVGPLRYALNEKLGTHTLSLRMPSLGAKAAFQSYAATFPDAFERIEEGIAFLKAKGVNRIYVLGHSMGARMASAFMAQRGHPDLAGLILVGGWDQGGGIFNTTSHVRRIYIPTLDIYGTADGYDVKAVENRAKYKKWLDHYEQAPIENAGHLMLGYEEKLTTVIAVWIEKREQAFLASRESVANTTLE